MSQDIARDISRDISRSISGTSAPSAVIIYFAAGGIDYTADTSVTDSAGNSYTLDSSYTDAGSTLYEAA